jgi:hypothetical protein
MASFAGIPLAEKMWLARKRKRLKKIDGWWLVSQQISIHP